MNILDMNRTIQVLTTGVLNPIVEVRMLKTKKGTVAGYYNSKGFDAIAKDLQYYNGKNNIYVVMNEANEDLIARGVNKLTEYATHTTKDADIIRRNWLLIDFDPERVAGVSATDQEKACAEILSKECKDYLMSIGFPAPIEADSGNGFHQIYKIDMENSEENKNLLQTFLKVIGGQFDNENVKLDKNVFNASRITKLYGTMATKGDSTEERPHRLSKLLNVPKEIVVLSKEQIEKYIESKSETIKEPIKESKNTNKSSKVNPNVNSSDLEAFISKHNISISHVKDESDKISYVLSECFFNPEHKSPDAAIFKYKDNGGFGFKCQHNSCVDKHWKDARLHFEPNFYDKKEPNPKSVSKEKKKPQSGADLWIKTLDPIKYVVDNMLSIPGAYLLAGASKMGKSWLGIDMSIAVSNGSEFFGKQTMKSKTLYIDLESSETSLKSRLKSMYKDGVDLDNWHYLHSFERIGEGFEEDLIELLHEHKFKLIVIDVFVKVRSVPQKGATEYQHDYHDLGVLKKIALEFGVCFVIVTHLRKMKDDDDVFNTMTGSTGLMGASDGALLLARKRGEDTATLYMDGRDIRSDALALMWDKQKTRWKYLGKSDEVKESNLSMQFEDSSLFEIIRRVLDDNGEIIMTPTELFTKITFDYGDVIDFPKSNTVFSKALMSNVINFQKKGIGIVRERSGRSRSIKIYNCPVTPVINVTAVTAVTAVTDDDNNVFSDSNI